MLVVAALGGNALLRAGERPDVGTQRANVALAADHLAAIAREHRLVITHGNGPQVGLLALQSEACEAVPPHPLDVLDAESEGLLGYLIEQELANRLPSHDVAALITRVEVDRDDPAFRDPTKPIGPVYGREDAARIARDRGWSMVADRGGMRRAVPSPRPRRILELATIRVLVDAGHVVVCAGGGGIPVIVDAAGGMRGVEAVVDKDRAAALLAERLGADALLVLTDVPEVRSAWPPPAGTPLGHVTPRDVSDLRLDPGTMGPKLEAACRYATATGGFAAIGALEDAERLLRGERGTIVRVPGGAP